MISSSKKHNNFNMMANIACCVVFLHIMMEHAGQVFIKVIPIDLFIACACLFFAGNILLRPPAKSEQIDLKTSLVCLCLFLYYLLLDTRVKGIPELKRIGEGVVSFALLFWVWGVATLGKSFSILPALRKIQTNGPYKLVRHPIYFSYISMDFGLLLIFPSLRNLAVFGLAICLYIVRANMEEDLLRYEKTYQEYCNNTQYKLIPLLL